MQLLTTLMINLDQISILIFIIDHKIHFHNKNN